MAHFRGGCVCGKIGIVASGAPNRVGICHSLECRKHHGALFYGAAIFPQERVAITGETREHRGRHFCPACGSSVFARTDDEIEVHLGVLENAETLVPTYEIWTIRRAPWLRPLPFAQQFKRGRVTSGQGDE